jgi:hypothetical protein
MKKRVIVGAERVKAAGCRSTKASAKLAGQEVPEGHIRSPAMDAYIAKVSRSADAAKGTGGEEATMPDWWRSGATFRGLLDDSDEFWRSPDGQRLQAVHEAAEADLQAWLAEQSGVVLHSHGGYAPEQWEGEVDGHSFYFRERDTEWDIEIDLRPSGQVMRVRDSGNDDGTTQDQRDEIVEGDVIATGRTTAQGYGDRPRERAAFIVATIREHLTRQACTHPDLEAIAALLDVPARWCPACGARVRGHGETREP